MCSCAQICASWDNVEENVASSCDSMLREIVELLQSVRAAEASLTAVTFRAAASQIVKIQSSKSCQIVREAFSSAVEEDAETQAEKTEDALPEAAELGRLCSLMLQACAAFTALPETWFRSLVKAQQHVSILSLESSAKACLGAGVEKLLRAAALIDDFMGPTKMPPFSESNWLAKAAVREGVLAMADLNQLAVPSEENALPGVEECLKALSTSATSSMVQLVADMRKEKDGIGPGWTTPLFANAK